MLKLSLEREPGNGSDRRIRMSSPHISPGPCSDEASENEHLYSHTPYTQVRPNSSLTPLQAPNGYSTHVEPPTSKSDLFSRGPEPRVQQPLTRNPPMYSMPGPLPLLNITPVISLHSIQFAGNSPPMNTLNPLAQEFHPPPEKDRFDMCAEFSKYLLKKDLLLSRLTKFTDSPDSYAIWKSSFKGIMKDLGVSAAEEVDLLVKWLGTDSGMQALSIRSAHPHDPKTGVARIWERLEDRYAGPELVESCLKARIAAFPSISNKDSSQLFELLDLVSEIAARKEDKHYSTMLAYFDSFSGANPIVAKLPVNIQQKWTTHGVKYKRNYGTTYPPFTVFVEFPRDIAKARNDPGFKYEQPSVSNTMSKSGKIGSKPQKTTISTRKTDVEKPTEHVPTCPLHNTKHTLNKCRGFRMKPKEERKKFLRDNSICCRCCGPGKHMAKDCDFSIKCEVCGSNRHPSALHIGIPTDESLAKEKEPKKKNPSGSINSTCTQVCKNPLGMSKSCAKTILVKVYPAGQPDLALKLYAIIDDQSNQTLARTSFLNHFGEEGSHMEYTLSSCSGCISTSGRKARGYVIESLDNKVALTLPDVIECAAIPNARDEIPTPEAAFHHPHLRQIADCLPMLDPEAEIMMLRGRDLPEAHHVEDQLIAPPSEPYGQRLKLGWVIIGKVCLGSVHQTPFITSNKTYTFQNGRPSLMKPCPNCFELKGYNPTPTFPVYIKGPKDDIPGLSVEDKESLQVMYSCMTKNSYGNWSAPSSVQARQTQAT